MMVEIIMLFGEMEHMFMQLVLMMVSVPTLLMGVVLPLRILKMMVVNIVLFGEMEHMFMQLVVMMVSVPIVSMEHLLL